MLSVLWKDVDWARGLCRTGGYDRSLFFDVDKEDEAVAVCELCPIRFECLNWALSWPERYGVWGGMRESERRRTSYVKQRVRCPGCASKMVDKSLDRSSEICRACGLSWPV